MGVYIMTRLQHLTALRDKVKAGSLWALSPEFERALLESHGMKVVYIAGDAYDGDLNAAKALHEALLPEGAQWSYYSDDGHCLVSYGSGPHDYAEAHDPDNPARAWLLAILEALIAQEGGE